MCTVHIICTTHTHINLLVDSYLKRRFFLPLLKGDDQKYNFADFVSKGGAPFPLHNIPPKLSSIGVEKDVFGTKKLILLKESYSFDDLVDNDTDNDTFWLTGVNDLLTFFMTL